MLVLKLKDGDVEIELFPDVAPEHVSRIKKLVSEKIKIPVFLWDERLSTVGAFNLSSQLDVNVTKRVKNIDENAAAFILQGVLDFLNN